MHQFSIVIPFHGNHTHFENTLASVLRYKTDNCEVVIVHDGSYEDPYELGEEVRAIKVHRSPNLIRFFNAGCECASGDLIAFLRPGTELTEGWNEPVEAAFANPKVGSVCPALVAAGRPKTLVAAGVDYKFGFRRSVVGNSARLNSRTADKHSPVGPTSWAAFFRAEAIATLDKIDSHMDEHFMDLEIALCLSTLGYECVFETDCVVSIASNGLVSREMKRPHGKSSQRAIRRHVLHLGTIANQGRSIQAFAWEVLSAPLHPWTFKHALQRLKARPYNVTDEEFSDDISVLARRLRFGAADGGLKVYREDAGHSRGPERQHLSKSNQRAA